MVALAGTAEEVAELGPAATAGRRGGRSRSCSSATRRSRPAGTGRPTAPLRVDPHRASTARRPAAATTPTWRGWRGTSRSTKLGLALGAGGAKGYAHVGALQVLEEAGYVVDCVAGSSIGAIVGSLPRARRRRSRDRRDPARRLRSSRPWPRSSRSPSPAAPSGLERDDAAAAGDDRRATFADTRIPLTIMAVDLIERAPAPLREGPLWEALLAATALAGLFPPYERDGHRLVDGLALVPVPTGAVVEDGADVTVAVNLIGRETLAELAGRPAARAAAGASAARRARRPARGDGSQPARRERAPRGAGRRRRSPRGSGPGSGATSISPISSSPPDARRPRQQLPALRSLALPAGNQANIERGRRRH